MRTTTTLAEPTTATPPGDAGAPTGPTSTDGRHARSERSRQRMVDALLALLHEGNPRPSSAQIAERAGVTQRTLFNQFGDMDTLVAAVAQRVAERVGHLLPEAGTGTLDERVARYCDGLAAFLEETMPIRWAVVTNPNPDWSGARMVQTMRRFMRDLLADAFAPELAGLAPDRLDLVLDGLELETDPVTWRLRRLQQGRSVAEARDAVAEGLRARLVAATAG